MSGRKGIVLAVAIAFGVLAASPVLAQELPVPKLRETKALQSLREAYQIGKQFCCQFRTGCISGPANGARVCIALRGRPFQRAYCGFTGRCIDP
jgi:hypothetical protein